MTAPRRRALDSKVARRIFLLFTVGAAVPVAVMTVLSSAAVSRQLREQGEEGLSQFSDVATQSILERLIGVREVMRSTGALVQTAQSSRTTMDAATSAVLLPPGVEGLGIAGEGGLFVIAGSVGSVPDLSPDNEAHLERGEAVLTVGGPSGEGQVNAFMALRISEVGGRGGTLWARIIADSMWAPTVTRASAPSVGDLCVLDSDGSPFYCVLGTSSELPGSILPQAERGVNSGRTELSGEDETHLVAWRDVYLRPAFNAPAWTVVVSRPVTSVYSAGDDFAYNLLLVILIGLSAVVLLTNALVRRTMEPLQLLTEGTERIAAQDFTARVDVQSRDEFGELASSFNTMADRLGLQFRQLEAGRAIDHTAIAATDEAQTVQALLEGVGWVVPSGPRAVLLADLVLPGASSLFLIDRPADAMSRGVHVGEEADQVRGLSQDAPFTVEREEDVPPIFRPLTDGGGRVPMLVLPLQVRGEPLGVMALTSGSERSLGDADARRAHALAEQAALAIAKLKLDKDLASMSWEVLRALANAIDAKSPWTAGHSERVTALSLVLGAELGLDSEDMNTLHRGGLLHDVGKIGVPAEVLDFDGPLDDEMLAIIQEHPAAGARILEPVRAFQPLLPIVLYHHERWDGQGYPEGLSGLAIPPLARLLGVADVFDAMSSHRPYRPALSMEAVRNHIVRSAGEHHDPEMVQALVRVMDGGWTPSDSTMSGEANA